MATAVRTRSTITCPESDHRSTETMPIDACQYLYACKSCGHQMKPKKGDCCIDAKFLVGRREDGRPSRSDVGICVERRMTAVNPAPGRAS